MPAKPRPLLVLRRAPDERRAVVVRRPDDDRDRERLPPDLADVRRAEVRRD
jgi:hypothetical protein